MPGSVGRIGAEGFSASLVESLRNGVVALQSERERLRLRSVRFARGLAEARDAVGLGASCGEIDCPKCAVLPFPARSRRVGIGAVLADVAESAGPPVAARGGALRVVASRAKVATDAGMLRRAIAALVQEPSAGRRGGTVLLGCRRRHGRLAVEVLHDGEVPDDDGSRAVMMAAPLLSCLGHGLSVLRRGGATVYRIDLPLV